MDVAAEGYEGSLGRRRGMDPLWTAALVATLVIHVGGIVAVARGAGAKKEDPGPVINVMVTKLVRKGKLKTFRGKRVLQSDVKKAIVTLEEGHSIDITTGL